MSAVSTRLRALFASRSPRPERSRLPGLETLEDRCLLSLAFTIQPKTATSGDLLAPIEVTLTGSGSGPVTIALADNPGAALLGGTVTRDLVAGKATFDNLVLFGGIPGNGFSLLAYAGGQTPVVSLPFALKTGGTNLHVATILPTAAAGANLGPIEVQVLDDNGTLARDDSTTRVMLLLDKNPGGARFVDANGDPLTDPLVATVANGVATFSNVRLDQAGIGYTLRAISLNDDRVRTGSSNLFAIVPGQAAKLGFQRQPQLAVANLPIDIGGRLQQFVTTGVVAQVADQFGNPLTSGSIPVTIALATNPSGATLGGLTTVDVVNGLAIFNSLVIDQPGVGYTFQLTSSALPSVVRESDSFNVLPDSPAKLVFRSSNPNTPDAPYDPNDANDPLNGFTPVRGKLPTIRVEVRDLADNLLTTDQTTFVTLGPINNVLGTTTVRVVDGIATFDNVFVKGDLLNPDNPNSLKIDVFARFDTLAPAAEQPVNWAGPSIKLKPGKAIALAFANPDIPALNPSGIVAGEYFQPVVVRVVDADGNMVTDDNTTKVTLGILQNGAHPQPTFIGNGYNSGDVPGATSGLALYAEATVTQGSATFDKLYVNPAGSAYQLSVGTQSLPFEGVNSKEFTVKVGQADHLQFVTQPTKTGSRKLINAVGPGISGFPVSAVRVAVVDRVNNVVLDDPSTPNRMITLAIDTLPMGGGTLQGITSLKPVNGVVLFDQVYVEQDSMDSIPGYTLKVSADGISDAKNSPSNAFQIDAPERVNGQLLAIPTFAFSGSVAGVAVGNPLQISLAVGTVGDTLYNGRANVNLQLLDANDNPLPGGPFLEGIGNDGRSVGRPAVGGVALFDYLRINKPGSYKIRALLDFGAQAIVSNVFTIGAALQAAPAALISVEQTPPPQPTIVDVGLASYTENFDYLTDPNNFPIYSKQADGTAKSLDQLRFAPSLQRKDGDVTPPPQVQPNVAVGFDQVPQTNDWWSSVMFKRNKVGPGETVVQHDANNNVLYPMYADPFATMLNSGDTFVGLGLTHLTQLFVSPTKEFTDSPPPGQDNVRKDPRFPGSDNYRYRYDGTNRIGDGIFSSQRMYQDLAIGLTNPNTPGYVVPDAKVLSYSDWTVRFDWGGRLQATLGRGLPFAYFTANVPTGGSEQMQILATDPNKNVTVTAFGNDQQTGALRLQVRYTTQEVDPQNPTQRFTVTVDNNYGIFLPSTVAWTLDNGRLSANLTKGKDYFSVAILPDGLSTPAEIDAAFAFYRARAYSFVTDATSNFSFAEASGKLTTTFRLETVVKESGPGLLDHQPLQALYVNQWSNLVQGSTTTDFTYVSARGTMKVFDGPVFATELLHQGTLPFVPPMPNVGSYHADLWRNVLVPFLRNASRQSLADGTFQLDENLLRIPGENYGEGQAMYGAAQLVPLLLEVANSNDGLSAQEKANARAMAERVFNVVKDRMSAWLSVKDDRDLQLLYYQPTTPNEAQAPPGGIGWQSLMSYLPGFESTNSLNDHHLIGGYFLKTAAILVQYDSSWGDETRSIGNGQTLQGKLGDVIDLMIRDISNYDRDDPMFPFLRNFDVYQGHSWADGAANSDTGNNQESTSEALNYASGLIQWGEAVGDRYLRDLGIYLYNTEIEAFETFYFNVNDTDAFPTDFKTKPDGVDHRPFISKLNEAGAQYSGFIGLLQPSLAGIQMVPFGGASYYLGRDTTFVNKLFAQVLPDPENAGNAMKDYATMPLTGQRYLSILYPYLALSDPARALTLYTSQMNSILRVNPGNPFDNDAFNLHWINVLNQYGKIDTTVRADTPSYAVFVKGTTRTFVAYNPDRVKRDVVFTDYTNPNNPVVVRTLSVPARSTLVASATTNLATQTGTDFSLQTPAERFFFSSASADGGQTFSLLHGKTGTGERTLPIPAPGQGSGLHDTPPEGKSLTFVLTGVSGNIKPEEQASFVLWLDPQYATSDKTSPVVRARITYDPRGDGQNLVVHTYNNITLSNNPGMVRGINQDLTLQILPYAPVLEGGTITIQLWGWQGNDNPILFRTDAVGEQGRVSHVDLPYTFSKINGTPVDQLAPTGPALVTTNFVAGGSGGEALPITGTGHTYRASLSADGNTATFTGNFASDTLVFSAAGGFLRHNRSSDPGFASDQDFDSFLPGVQRLQAARSSQVIIDTGTGRDVVVLGTDRTPASALLARFRITNRDTGLDQLTIEDGARNVLGNYTVDGTSLTTADDSIDVAWGGGAFRGGVLVRTGSAVNAVQVLATRAGEPLTLDTEDGPDVVTIGQGSVQGIRGNVIVKNANSFTDLIVDNSQAFDFARVVTLTATGITGLAPATISYAIDTLDDLEVYGGTNNGTYLVAGSIAGSYLYLDTGFGNDQVTLSNRRTVSDAIFPGLVILEGGAGTNSLLTDNVFGGPKNLATSARGLTGLIGEGLEFANFDRVGVLLGIASDTVTVDGSQEQVVYGFDLGGGADMASVRPRIAPLTLNGQGGDDVFLVGNPVDTYSFPVVLNGGIGNDVYAIPGSNSTIQIVEVSGVDTLDFSGAVAGVKVSLALGRGQLQTLGTTNTKVALFGTFENLVGSAFADDLTGNTGANVVRGLTGNDVLRGIAGPDLLDGGTGNDRLVAGTGNSILLGGANDDRVEAGVGRNLLIGGTGSDMLLGGVPGGRGSVLIGGSTTHDVNDQALRALLAEWSSARALLTRTRNLTNGSGSVARLNGGFFLNSTTLVDDGVLDVLFGNSRVDWFLPSPTDQVIDRA